MIIIANWKMNLDFNKSIKLASEYLKLDPPSNIIIIVLGSDLVLQDLVVKFKGSNIKVFAQDCSRFEGEGSYTGEISAMQLKKLGVKGVFLGHIERRLLLNEDDDIIALKLRNALNTGIDVVVNIGEINDDLSYLGSLKLFDKQLNILLKDLDVDKIKNNLMVSYESKGSISSLRSESEKQDDIDLIINKGEFIRSWLDKRFNNITIPLLYGGSLDRKEIIKLKETNVYNGFLIGRNSLNIDRFKRVVNSLSY